MFVSAQQKCSKHTVGLPHSLALEDAHGQLFLIVPSYGLVRPKIQTCPLSTELVPSPRDSAWASMVETRYFVYPVHSSGTFLLTQTLVASFYLALLRLFSRQYELAARIITSCHKDSALTKEENWILSHVKQTQETDSHPDALACRLRLLLLCFDCGSTPLWDNPPKDYNAYISVHSHVSVACRLSAEEEQRLLSYMPNSERLKYLSALADAPCNFRAGVSEMAVGGQMAHTLKTQALPRVLNSSLGSPNSGLGSTQIMYERPEEEEITGASAIRLLDDIWNSRYGLLGWGVRHGFCILYDILLGRRRLKFINDEAFHIRAISSSREQQQHSASKDTPKSKKETKVNSSSSTRDSKEAEMRSLRHTRIANFLEENGAFENLSTSGDDELRNSTSRTMPWESSKFTIRPDLEEDIAQVDGGKRKVTKSAATFVKLLAMGVILKSAKGQQESINLQNPSGVSASMLIGLAEAILADLPLKKTIENSSKLILKATHDNARKHSTWQMQFDGNTSWTDFGAKRNKFINEQRGKGLKQVYLDFELSILSKPLTRWSSVKTKPKEKWGYVKSFDEKTGKYQVRSYSFLKPESFRFS